MTDDFLSSNYLNFDSQQLFFSKSNEDNSNLHLNFKFTDGPLINFENNSVLHLNSFDNPPHVDHPNNKNTDSLSTYSNSSTNCSSKHSPEYVLADGGQNDVNEYRKVTSQVPPIQKKNIHKYYEPIFDGHSVFKYEDNPLEYKKARK